MNLDTILEDLKKERARLDRAIAALEESGSPRAVGKKARVTARQPAASKGKQRGGLTEEGRKRLSLAMKKRWAERRKKSS